MASTGLRAFLRFLTGLYVCLNRGDVDPKAQQVLVYSTLLTVLFNLKWESLTRLSLFLVFIGRGQQKQPDVL